MCTNNSSDMLNFDFSADFEDSNYKSCFARSMVVNSQFHSSKSLDFGRPQKTNENIENKTPVFNEINRLKKEEPPPRRLSTPITPSRRCTTDMPVETLALHSQVDLLQWQLRQAESSRQMYRAVMQQVVCFLERAHRSLDLLGAPEKPVPRTRSEFIVGEEGGSFRDYTWRRPKRQQQSPDEIPPDKLSQEAFRLLRTAQSLLNTREPDLAHVSTLEPIEKDQEFLSQIAKEFPPKHNHNHNHPQRTTSFNYCPNTQQITNLSERDIRISTALNRKLSLQRTPSLRYEPTKKHNDQNLNNGDDKRSSITSIKRLNMLIDDKNTTGSVSSAEDESGFSSMNSFQEVGLPIMNSTVNDVNDTLGDLSIESSDSNITQINTNINLTSHQSSLEKSKLIWNRNDFSLPINHRRWSSTPVDVQTENLKVLWV